MSEQETAAAAVAPEVNGHVATKQPHKYRIDAEDVTRLDEYSVPPDQIIMEVDQNGRSGLHADESVDEMVESLIAQGQLQAIVCRKTQGSKLMVVVGYRRLRAFLKIVNTPELMARMKVPAGHKLKVRVKLKDLNDEEAFIENLTENMIRDDLTPLDHSHNQRLLRERYHWDDEKIASFYKHSVSYVCLLKRAHQIPSELQQLIREKKLSLSDGIDLTALPEKEQVEVVHAAQDGTGTVDSGAVKKAVRTRKVEEGGKKARTLKEVKKFFEVFATENDVGPAHLFADATIKFLEGRILEKTYQDKLLDLIREE